MIFIKNLQNFVSGSLNLRTNIGILKLSKTEENKEEKNAEKPVAGVCQGQN